MRIRLRKLPWTAMFLAIALGSGWSQADSGQQSGDGEVPSSIAIPEPDAVPPMVETPPVSGLDQAPVDSWPARSPRYLNGGIQVSEGQASNPQGALGNSSQFSSVANVLGNLELRMVRPRSDTAIRYAAGSTFYGSSNGVGAYSAPLQQLNAEQRFLWRRGQLTVKDSFQDMSGGNFGLSSFGGAGAYRLRFADGRAGIPVNSGGSDFFGATQLSDVEQRSFITNVSGVALTEALSPRSSIFLAGAYSFTDYSGSTVPLINSHQISAQAGYQYQLNRKESIGVVYGYQTFRFQQSDAGDITTNSMLLIYRRRVSGRMDLILGGGPESATVKGGTSGSTQQINTTIQASLRYRLKRSDLSLSYNRLVTAGSGFLAGGTSDIVRFSLNRNFSRSWQSTLNGGYARVSTLAPRSTVLPGSSYWYLFMGAAVQRRLGRQFEAFASYQFNDENFNNSFCGPSATCNSGAARRQIALIGLSWHIRPIRLE